MEPTNPKPETIVDVSKVTMVDHVLIRDRDTGQVLLNKRGSEESDQEPKS